MLNELKDKVERIKLADYTNACTLHATKYVRPDLNEGLILMAFVRQGYDPATGMLATAVPAALAELGVKHGPWRGMGEHRPLTITQWAKLNSIGRFIVFSNNHAMAVVNGERLHTMSRYGRHPSRFRIRWWLRVEGA
jgi:hypothetical protein